MNTLKVKRTQCQCSGVKDQVYAHIHETEKIEDFVIGEWCSSCRQGGKIDPEVLDFMNNDEDY